MKLVLLLIVTTFFSYQALAETCTTELRNRNHIVISSFDGWGQSMSEACFESRLQCNDELSWRLDSGNYPGAYCIDLNAPTPPPTSEYACYSNLRLANGSYVASYRGKSRYTEQEACSNALRTCYTDLRRRQNNSRYYNAYCEIDRNRRPVPPRPNPTPTPSPWPTPDPDPTPGTVTRTCQSALLSDTGDVIQVFTASLTGNSSDRSLGREACDTAMEKCEAVRSGSESCRLH